jgi:hypothetical protein
MQYTYAALRDYAPGVVREDESQEHRKSLTAGVEPRKSCIVKGGGITKAVKVASGASFGSGMDARNAFLTLSNSWGSSILGEMY